MWMQLRPGRPTSPETRYIERAKYQQPNWAGAGASKQRVIRAVLEEGSTGEGAVGRGQGSRSGAGVLFPFLEAAELALDGKRSLLGLRRVQINVDLLLLLHLLGVPGFGFLLTAGSLAWK